MADSGTVFDLTAIPGIKVDKHSTGGVGDKVSLVLAPLVAACGAVVPMMSGRGLGHTGGTLDKLESIPGFRVNLSEAEFKATLGKIGVAMIGQTAEVAPADKKLYTLRDVTGTVESIPLITASILGKKLAEGISGLVMDVKCGRGAFMKTLPQARELAQSITRVGTLNGLKVQAIITNMDAPLGQAVGNALEVVESIEALKGGGPADLRELCLSFAAAMLDQAGIPDGAERARKAFDSGAALEKFRELIAAQGGDPSVVDDPSRLPQARSRGVIVAEKSGFIAEIDAEQVGIAALELGAGRVKAEDCIDPSVGILVFKKPGDKVRVGEAVFEIHHNAKGLAAATARLNSCVAIADDPSPPPVAYY
jgi:pyrimidine-nucleoside phosphorylase